MTVRIVSCADARTWDRLVDRAGGATVFHRSAVLDILERHCDGAVHRLVGYKGAEPIGLFPVFELTKGGITAVFSPPPRLGVLFQGPVLVADENLTQRKLERRNRRFIVGCLEWITDRVEPSYERVCTTPAHADVRPFEWREYSITPRFTYAVDLTSDRAELKRSFSSTPRKNIDSIADDVELERGDRAGIRFVHEQIRSRYEAQGKRYTVPLEFLFDLAEETPDATVQTYVATLDGEPASGLLTLRDDETVYFSEGGGKPDTDTSINDHLHWRVMHDAKERGCSVYDLQGANTPRICSYKSKFNPALQTYYEIEAGTPLATIASKLYRSVR